jgi:geranylgeranyl diphosphate synthase type II
MQPSARIEAALRAAVNAAATGAPPRLAAAIRHAVLPGGARIRPQLALAVATACGDDRPAVSDAAAAAIELIHCASLVHDDLPCFDDAATRRGRPSVHRAFSEPLALLAGDALIVLAFETLARGCRHAPDRLALLVGALARATGLPGGICAGQGWESEERVDLRTYHRAKTGSLFVAATTMGALAAGRDPGPWRALGLALGEAYQIADDLRDALSGEAETGKPCRQDALHGRPSAVRQFGAAGARARLDVRIAAALAAIPPGPGETALREIVVREAERLAPVAARIAAA